MLRWDHNILVGHCLAQVDINVARNKWILWILMSSVAGIGSGTGCTVTPALNSALVLHYIFLSLFYACLFFAVHFVSFSPYRGL